MPPLAASLALFSLLCGAFALGRASMRTLACEVDPDGPYVPAAHAAPEHVEAPAVGTHTYHIWIREKLRAYIRFEVGALLPVSLDMHACCLYPLGLRHASACALILPCVSL